MHGDYNTISGKWSRTAQVVVAVIVNGISQVGHEGHITCC